jgi:hypothetical protein
MWFDWRYQNKWAFAPGLPSPPLGRWGIRSLLNYLKRTYAPHLFLPPLRVSPTLTSLISIPTKPDQPLAELYHSLLASSGISSATMKACKAQLNFRCQEVFLTAKVQLCGSFQSYCALIESTASYFFEIHWHLLTPISQPKSYSWPLHWAIKVFVHYFPCSS